MNHNSFEKKTQNTMKFIGCRIAIKFIVVVIIYNTSPGSIPVFSTHSIINKIAIHLLINSQNVQYV